MPHLHCAGALGIYGLSVEVVLHMAGADKVRRSVEHLPPTSSVSSAQLPVANSVGMRALLPSCMQTQQDVISNPNGCACEVLIDWES